MRMTGRILRMDIYRHHGNLTFEIKADPSRDPSRAAAWTNDLTVIDWDKILARALRKIPRHGTFYRYAQLHCPCAACKEAGRKRNEQYRNRPLSEKKLQCGKLSTYNNGCHCAECRKANTDYQKKIRCLSGRKRRKP